jgi:hypothetical protein
MKNEIKILCPYCNAEWTAQMETALSFSEGSYTTGCVGSKIKGTIDIYCENCKKLIYRKEVDQDYAYLEWEQREENED